MTTGKKPSAPAQTSQRGVELVWGGKTRAVERVALPFQVIETVNEPREKNLFTPLHAHGAWRNKLIWGDNKLVMASLLEEYVGKINLIYIDPPFATGQDFSFRVRVGDEDLTKEPSLLEEKAYRDTWGRGLASYLQMMYERLVLMRQLLTGNGSIYVHLDYHVGHYVKVILDELFGVDMFQAELVWKRKDAQSYAKGYGVIHDVILFYTKSDDGIFNKVFVPLSQETADNWYSSQEVAHGDCTNRLGQVIKRGTVRRFNKADISAPGDRTGTAAHYEWKRCWPPPGRHWQYTKDVLEALEREGRLVYSSTGRVYEKRYLDESKGTPLQTLWADVSHLRGMSKRAASSEWQNFDTQKPEALLERILSVSSNPGDLVADVFCGSGTTLAVAEKLGRRWFGCDLGRFAIHTTRKRLLDMPGCKPFEVLNLGKYERQYWQAATTGSALQRVSG